MTTKPTYQFRERPNGRVDIYIHGCRANDFKSIDEASSRMTNRAAYWRDVAAKARKQAEDCERYAIAHDEAVDALAVMATGPGYAVECYDCGSAYTPAADAGPRCPNCHEAFRNI